MNNVAQAEPTNSHSDILVNGSIAAPNTAGSSFINQGMNLLRFGSIHKKEEAQGTQKKNNSKENSNNATERTTSSTSVGNNMVISHCRCCDTLLKFPEKVIKFKCSVCQSTIILVDSQVAEDNYQIGGLSLNKIKNKIQECHELNAMTPDPQNELNVHQIFKPLELFLSEYFGSFDKLNNSFKISKDPSCQLSHLNSNLDYIQIKKSFDLISQLPTKRPFYRMLLSANDLLRRPSRKITSARDLKWLLILLEIPTIPSCLYHNKKNSSDSLNTPEIKSISYEIIKRVIGYLSNSNTDSLKYLASWVSTTPKDDFDYKVQLLNLYVTFHMTRLINKHHEFNTSYQKTISPTSPTYCDYSESSKLNSSLPESLGRAGSSAIRSSNSITSPFLNLPASFHTKFTGWSDKKSLDKPIDFKLGVSHYGNEWHIKTATRLLSVFYVSNKNFKLPIYSFYNSLVDYVNVKQDFEIWQYTFKQDPSINLNDQTILAYDCLSKGSLILGGKNPRFTFCQFPFLLSLGAKISILEYEARKTMERKAEEAFINALDQKKVMDVYLRIKVRRSHISNDSLRSIKERRDDLKKSLKVEFIGEPGIDVGGLKKEWFYLLTRELFNQENGMFFYNDESHLCWFAPMPLERNDELFYMVGVVLGLAIYNSTILDLRFPLALYKKLLDKKIFLEDYIELFPETGHGLLKLLNYKGDVSKLEIYFEIEYKGFFGEIIKSELIPNGSRTLVTNQTAKSYVNKWIEFYMTKKIKPQFDSFYKGFHNVLGGNSLSLFSPKEIEMMICGNTNGGINCEVLESVTKYSGWNSFEEAVSSKIVSWFWEWLNSRSLNDQRKFLRFVTGSDRIPATGIGTMNFKISKLSGAANRFPIAHTCFNELCLYEYTRKEDMVRKLEISINESEGFGLR